MSEYGYQNLVQQATAFVAAGNASKRFGDKSAALNYYREASAVLSEVLSVSPRDSDARVRLSACYNEIGEVSLRMMNVDTAVESFHKALLLLDPAAAEKRLNEPELYTAADSYAGLGQTETFPALHSHTATQRMSHWNEASSWCERSLAVWSKIKEPAAIRPDGFDCLSQVAVTRQFARCKAARARLAARSSVP